MGEKILGILPLDFKFDLLQIGVIKSILKHRAFQYAVIIPNLFFFVIIILSGLFGTPSGAKNFSIIFVWIVWWFFLITILVPFGSRIWCTMCPIPAPAEWLQRRAFIKKNSKSFGLNREWPRKLRNLWIANFGFLSIAVFSAILTTRPIATGVLLLGLIITAIILHTIFEKRSFCRYVCPVGGFLGLYSMFASLELRVKDREVCRKHKEKECIKGSEKGWGCPWFQYPGNMERNNYCGLCTECIKTCPNDNIALNLRTWGKDLLVRKERHLDEAWKSFIMLTLAVLYVAVMQGPWGWIKDWATMTSLKEFGLYAFIFIGSALLLTPGIFLAFTWISKLLSGIEIPLKQMFVDYSYTLVPLGLAGWIGFSWPIMLINGSYAISLISDPFGWGWNLFGTDGFHWTPFASGFVPYLQVLTMLLGLAFSIDIGHKISKQISEDEKTALRSLIPIVIFLTGVTLVLLWLYVG